MCFLSVFTKITIIILYIALIDIIVHLVLLYLIKAFHFADCVSVFHV